MSASASWNGPRSLLELWHPQGAPARRLEIGGAAQAASAGVAPDGADFALVAPQAGDHGADWLSGAIGRAAAAVEPGGVLCVVVARRWRRTAHGLLARAGLECVDALLLAPPWPASAHVVPLRPATLRDAGARHLGLRPATAARAATLARSAAGRALLRGTAPGCALLAVRAPGPAPLDWLGALGETPRRCTATASTGPRADARVAVVMRFAAGDTEPDIVAKVALDGAGGARVERERAALAALGAGARAAGAAVPDVLPARGGVLAAPALAGRQASALIAADGACAATVLGALAAWLSAWAAATAARAPAGRDLLERLLIAPAARVAEHDGGDALARHLAALRGLAARLEGRPIVLAAAHNDLTMSNVLVGGGLGVVDWESACEGAPPLADLWYALADGVARARRGGHAEAVGALVRGTAPLPAALAGAPDEQARRLGLGADEALLSFHACWLLHAADELERGARETRFRAVVRAVAEQRLHPADGEGGA